jgi:hypothetical protein
LLQLLLLLLVLLLLLLFKKCGTLNVFWLLVR